MRKGYKGFLRVAVPGGGSTVREHRPDADHCAHCGRGARTLYDYFDSEQVVLVDDKVPAFCNKACALGYMLKPVLRQLSVVDDEPHLVPANRPSVKPKKTSSQRRSHLSAVGRCRSNSYK